MLGELICAAKAASIHVHVQLNGVHASRLFKEAMKDVSVQWLSRVDLEPIKDDDGDDDEEEAGVRAFAGVFQIEDADNKEELNNNKE